ncbi:MAG: ComEA family DNA-binding protein, partial [Longimicrobiales bacterium]
IPPLAPAARPDMTLSTDERRALAIIAGLLVAASGARWLERPQPLLEDVAALDVAALEQASRAGRPDPAASRGAASGQKTSLDPNTATAAELDRLPGIGPVLAARIVEERTRGPFTTVEDLTRVPGIGAALATRLAGQVSLPAGPARSKTTVAGGLTPGAEAHLEGSGRPAAEPPDLNHISSADLQKVRGVGPSLAGRLIARRDSLRRFTSWDQVDEVAGVGPALLSRLKESLVLRP